MVMHNLKLKVLPNNRNINITAVPLTMVTVTKDTWTYNTGREIEFIGVGLPKKFAFVVSGQDNSDEAINTGDCRSGSWSGIASEIAPNVFQAIEGYGSENAASGLAAFGTARRVPMYGGVAFASMGGPLAYGLASAYVGGYSSLTAANRFNLPKNGRPQALPTWFYSVNLGTAFDVNTKTVRGTPSEIREALYKFDGTLATTNFNRLNGANQVGGITYMSGYSNSYMGLPAGRLGYSSVPVTSGGISDVTDGFGRGVNWTRYFIAGGTNTSPYQIHYLFMEIGVDGNPTFSSTQGFTPPADGGAYGSEAFTYYSDNKDDTFPNTDNMDILKSAYHGTLARSRQYSIHRAIEMPNRFNIRIKDYYNNAGAISGSELAYSWAIYADFINHEYKIGE